MIIKTWYVIVMRPFRFLEITLGYKLKLDARNIKRTSCQYLMKKNHRGVKNMNLGEQINKLHLLLYLANKRSNICFHLLIK
jgi:hypothetical protein